MFYLLQMPRPAALRRMPALRLVRAGAGTAIVALTAISATQCIHSGVCGTKAVESTHALQMLAPRTTLTFAPPVATVSFERAGQRAAGAATF